MNHPNSIDLEAFACGEALARVGSHVESCEACRAFVERARSLARTAPRFDVDRVLSRPPESRPRARRIVAPRTWGLVAAPALAAAAALTLLIRAPEGPAPTIERAPSSLSRAAATVDPETRFKGGVQVAVVRERGASQERFSGGVSVRPGDRLRVEVALDRTRTILAAVLGDDGTYLELMTDITRDAGSHFSEQSTRIDARPMSGTIVVGAPESVRRARTTRDFADLDTVRVVWEAP